MEDRIKFILLTWFGNIGYPIHRYAYPGNQSDPPDRKTILHENSIDEKLLFYLFFPWK